MALSQVETRERAQATAVALQASGPKPTSLPLSGAEEGTSKRKRI